MAWRKRPRDILDGFLLRQSIVWVKSGGINHTAYAFTPGYEVLYLIVKEAEPGWRRVQGKDWTTVWSIPRVKDSDHPAPFPLEVPLRCIKASDAQVVLDPFMGSGTTAVAAVLEGRDYIGFDLNAKYCQDARERVALAKDMRPLRQVGRTLRHSLRHLARSTPSVTPSLRQVGRTLRHSLRHLTRPTPSVTPSPCRRSPCRKWASGNGRCTPNSRP